MSSVLICSSTIAAISTTSVPSAMAFAGLRDERPGQKRFTSTRLSPLSPFPLPSWWPPPPPASNEGVAIVEESEEEEAPSEAP